MAEEAVSDFHVRSTQVEWKIHNFLELPHKNGEELQSDTFSVCDTKYLIGIYPNGKDESHVEWVSICLNFVEGHGDRVLCSYSIKFCGSLIEKDTLSYTFNILGERFSFRRFILRSELSKILQQKSSDGALTVKCRVKSLKVGREYAGLQASVSRGTENLIQNFETLFLEGHESDVKLKVEGREFDAHKLILVARSPVFAATFKTEMLESSNGVVEIPDMNPEMFKDFLHFVYTGKFSCVTPQNALALYKTGDKYDLQDLKEECLQKMTSANGLSVHTVLDVISAAVSFEEKTLMDAATKYFIANAEKMFATDEWKTFFIENTQIAKELLIKMTKSLKSDHGNKYTE